MTMSFTPKYDRQTYCATCMEGRPLYLLRCPECNQKLRSEPRKHKNLKKARI